MNKIVAFFLSLFSFLILFCSCNSKNNITSNQKIAYAQSSHSSNAVNNILSSNISINTSKLSASSVLINSDFLKSSSISSVKSSEISPSSHTSQSSQTIHTSSALSYTKKDAVNLYNSALIKTLTQNYICFNFSNTMNSGKELRQSGNIVLKIADGKDVFLKTYTDGSTYYCDGNTVFIQQIISPGNKLSFTQSYTQNEYYKYINLLIYAIDSSNIKSFNENANAETTNISFVVTNCSDYSKICDIFVLDSAKTTINKVTLIVQIKGGVITNYTQQFDLTYDGTQRTGIINNAFYTKKKDYVLSAPIYLKTGK